MLQSIVCSGRKGSISPYAIFLNLSFARETFAQTVVCFTPFNFAILMTFERTIDGICFCRSTSSDEVRTQADKQHSQ